MHHKTLSLKVNVTLFSQIISKLDRSKFKKLVKTHKSDKHQKGFDSWSNLASMLFFQFPKNQSVLDMSNGFRSVTRNLNHLGMLKATSKFTVSYQNKKRSWELANQSRYYRCFGILFLTFKMPK